MEMKNQGITSKQVLLAEIIYWGLWGILLFMSFIFSLFLSLIHIPLILSYIISFYFSLCFLGYLLPKPKAGIHKLSSLNAKKWFINFQYGKIWNIPFIKHIIFSSFILRPIFLKACGCKIPFRIAPSAYMRISDPFMIELGQGCVVGIDVVFAGHTIVGDKLALMKVRVGKNCTIGAKSSLTAGSTVGDNVILERGCILYPLSKIPNRVKVGHSSEISQGFKIKEGDVIPPYTKV